MNRTQHLPSYEPSQLRHKGDLSPIKPRQKMPTIYRHRRHHEQTKSDFEWLKDNSYLKKRCDRTVQVERDQMLMKTGRTSIDNPEWMNVNFQHYKRSNYSIPGKYDHKEQRFYDVFNNPKRSFKGRNEDLYFIKMQRQSPQKPQATDLSTLRKTLQHSQLLHGDVANKVGSTNQRDYTIRRPLLKIGSTSKESYIDTYSPF